MRRIRVGSQSRETVCTTVSQKFSQKPLDVVSEGLEEAPGLNFKPQSHREKKQNKTPSCFSAK
jgi:hypothetical protein